MTSLSFREAVILGSGLRYQGFKGGFFDDDCNPTACVLETAALAVGFELSPLFEMYPDVAQQDLDLLCHEMERAMDYVKKHWPELEIFSAECPVINCHERYSLLELCAHMNDDHHIGRLDIADWVQNRINEFSKGGNIEEYPNVVKWNWDETLENITKRVRNFMRKEFPNEF